MLQQHSGAPGTEAGTAALTSNPKGVVLVHGQLRPITAPSRRRLGVVIEDW